MTPIIAELLKRTSYPEGKDSAYISIPGFLVDASIHNMDENLAFQNL